MSRKGGAKNIEKIAVALGARFVGRVPDTGGGAFGAARLAKIVETMQARLVPGQGSRTQGKPHADRRPNP